MGNQKGFHVMIQVKLFFLKILIPYSFETKCRQPMPKHMMQLTTLAKPSGREGISESGIELPTSSLRFGYLSTIIQ